MTPRAVVASTLDKETSRALGLLCAGRGRTLPLGAQRDLRAQRAYERTAEATDGRSPCLQTISSRVDRRRAQRLRRSQAARRPAPLPPGGLPGFPP